eukprot:scaffold60807_cov62-Attheya_sp.AAC.4
MSSSGLFDVIVIGGGLSGLAAAQKILAEQPQTKVRVLEARDRVGGRTHTILSPELNIHIDVGGAYVGPTQDCILRVAKEVGVETYDVYTKGRVMYHDTDTGEIKAGSIDIPPFGAFALLEFNALLVKIESLVGTINAEQPSLSSHADLDALDKMSVQEWCQLNARSTEVRNMFPRIMDTLLCKDSKEVSMLYFLWYARSGDCLKRLVNVKNGAQEKKFAGGSEQISDRMAEKLGLGSVVLLDSPVSGIDQSKEEQVYVTCQDGREYTTKRIIVALAPPLYKKIQWTPELPAEKLAIANNFSMGHVIKIILVYESAWWRDLGLSGQIWDTNGPVLYSMDDCKPAKVQSESPAYPALMGFCLADDAKFWTSKTREERKDAVTQQYAKMFNCDKALDPIAYIEKDWNQEEFSGGCYVATPEIGMFLETSQSLRQPFDKVHFGGTELATSWAGYMDGAIQSGERAGREVLSEIYGQTFDKTLVAVEPRQIPVNSMLPSTLEKVLAWLFDTYIKYRGTTN